MRGQTRYYMFASAPTGTQWDQLYPQLQPAEMPPKQKMRVVSSKSPLLRSTHNVCEPLFTIA